MKKQLWLLLALSGLWLVAGTSAACAQAEEKVYTEVDQVPEFPGGINAMYAFLARNIRYPVQAARNKVEGKVITSFVVGKDGKIRNVTVETGVENSVDQEAVRVIRAMPKWKPGEREGQKVDVYYKMPINFQVQ
jgi:periplasmic protein TonB